MSVTARLAGFAAVLATVFGIAALAGGAIGPPHPTDKPTHGGHGGHDTEPAGLALAQDGYRITVERPALPAGRPTELRFRVLDPDGKPVHSFEEEHGAKLHLIVVRRDLTGYQHLHPRLAADGTWSIPLTLATPGSYRIFADFHAAGHALTLGADLSVPGRFEPRALPPAATTASVDGYDVELTERPGGVLRFSVRRDGREVTDLQPYLGARGHLVALREGDLAYLHVHPEEGPQPGAGVSFMTEFPSAGRYRLFLQFRHGGRVHTTEFTREVSR
jgi:hypothetical protein